MKKLMIGLVLSGVIGCASAEKKACETQDWYEFGKSRALEGSTPESSPMIKTCQEFGIAVDSAKMAQGFKSGIKDFCQPKTFEQTAALGEPKNTGLCSAESQKALEAAKTQGLKKHCTQMGAFTRGKSGKPNPKVCPEKLQKSYNDFYARGRVVFLKGEVLKIDRRNTEIARRQKAIAEEIPTHEANRARWIYLEQKKDKSTTESLERLTATNPVSAIEKLTLEKQLLNEELNRNEIQKQDLESEIVKNELEVLDFQPSGQLEEEKS
jgi:hypothetical protein